MLETSDDHLNGVVLNVRNQEIHISVWTKALSVELHEKSLQWLKNSIDCSAESLIEYKPKKNIDSLTNNKETILISTIIRNDEDFFINYNTISSFL